MSFQANPRLAAELGLQSRVALAEKAKRVQSEAEKLTHSAMPRHRSGRIIVGEVSGDVAVINTNFGGHLEEWGSAHNPPYAPLRRGARAAGLELRES